MAVYYLKHVMSVYVVTTYDVVTYRIAFEILSASRRKSKRFIVEVSVSIKAVMRWGFQINLSHEVGEYDELHEALVGLTFRETAKRIKAGTLDGNYTFKLTDHTAPRAFPRFDGPVHEYKVEA